MLCVVSCARAAPFLEVDAAAAPAALHLCSLCTPTCSVQSHAHTCMLTCVRLLLAPAHEYAHTHTQTHTHIHAPTQTSTPSKVRMRPPQTILYPLRSSLGPPPTPARTCFSCCCSASSTSCSPSSQPLPLAALTAAAPPEEALPCLTPPLTPSLTPLPALPAARTLSLFCVGGPCAPGRCWAAALWSVAAVSLSAADVPCW